MKKIIASILMLCLYTTSYASSYEGVVDDYYAAPTEQIKIFDDVTNDMPAKEAIDYLYKYKIVSGGYDNKFDPNSNITREQFVKILILAFGLYDETATSDFIDSTEKDWHYPYISSAKKLGLVNGISENTFGVGIDIQRQEMVAMAYRVAQYVGYSFGEQKSEAAAFSDSKDIAEYAKDPVSAFNSVNALTFVKDNKFCPKEYATRAEACMMIYEIIKKTN